MVKSFSRLSSSLNLLLVGCGNIGGALLKSWASSQFLNQMLVIQPSLSRKKEFEENKKIEFISGEKDLPSHFKPDITVLALKPQNLKDINEGVFLYCRKSLIISFLAGVKIDGILSYVWKNEKNEGKNKKRFKIVRIMPNIALKTHESVNLAYASPSSLSESEVQSVNQIFSPLGQVIWLPHEKWIELLTPLSSSGLAYFFLMAEVLTQIAVQMGIAKDLARTLMQKTLLGSASLVSQGHNFEDLIDQVSSRGGVTEEALKVLRPALREIMEKSIQAALKRLERLERLPPL